MRSGNRMDEEKSYLDQDFRVPLKSPMDIEHPNTYQNRNFIFETPDQRLYEQFEFEIPNRTFERRDERLPYRQMSHTDGYHFFRHPQNSIYYSQPSNNDYHITRHLRMSTNTSYSHEGKRNMNTIHNTDRFEQRHTAINFATPSNSFSEKAPENPSYRMNLDDINAKIRSEIQ